jgi:hypothetical protein
MTAPSVSATSALTATPRYWPALLVWALLLFNGMSFGTTPELVPIPASVGKLAPQVALVAAMFAVLIFNRERLIRPNLFLSLYSLLAIVGLIASARMDEGLGSVMRSGRFIIFVGALWLLTPCWGRRDRVILRCHVACLTFIIGMVLVGAVVAPGKATRGDGRLTSVVWPIASTQVGHYAALLAGILCVLALAREAPRFALPLAAVAVAVLMWTHTRTAIVGLIAGILAAAIILVPIRRRARRALLAVIAALFLLGTIFAPAASNWLQRGETSDVVGTFNGRAQVWDEIRHTPRSAFETLVGRGVTNASFNGLPVDNSWYATYLDEGLLGDALCAAVLLSLLMLASTRPRGSSLAVALFIIVYCGIASITETGLGDVSPYILDLTLAAGLLAST